MFSAYPLTRLSESHRVTPMVRFAVLLALASGPITTWAQVAPDAKVVFLKGTALMTANADGSNVQTLVNDGIPKSHPQWSPAGDKIVYETGEGTYNVPGGHPVTGITNMVVVTAGGQLLNTIPQNTGVDWGFSMDGIGWYSENAVFVTGHLNRFDDGYVSLDLSSGQAIQNILQPTGGGDPSAFQTCGTSAQVAYPVDMRYLGTASITVQVNGSTVYTAQLPPAPPFYLAELHWSGDCSRLGFIETVNTSSTLVVVSGTSVEARVPIPADAGWPVTVVPLGSSFMIRSSARDAFFYDTAAHTLRPAPDILQQLQQRENAEAKVMQTLGGQSPDWHRPSR